MFLFIVSFMAFIIVSFSLNPGVNHVNIHGTLACLARRHRRHFTTHGLFSDNPGSTSPGSKHWTEGIEPSAKDLEYFEELAEQ
jgi:hypothetical protein